MTEEESSKFESSYTTSEEPATEEGPDILTKLKAASDENLPEVMGVYQSTRDRYSDQERATVDAYLQQRLYPSSEPKA
jgi:hypothetical protein